MSFFRLRDFVAVDLLHRDLGESVVREERQEMIRQRPLEISKRLLRETLGLARAKPLRCELVERRFLRQGFGHRRWLWWTPKPFADECECVRKFLLGSRLRPAF
jgi:hypothetical protein